MDKNGKQVVRSNEYFDNLTFWSFVYYVLKGFATKIFSHGVFVIVVIILTILVCQMSMQTKNVEQPTKKEVKLNESNSKTN